MELQSRKHEIKKLAIIMCLLAFLLLLVVSKIETLLPPDALKVSLGSKWDWIFEILKLASIALFFYGLGVWATIKDFEWMERKKNDS